MNKAQSGHYGDIVNSTEMIESELKQEFINLFWTGGSFHLDCLHNGKSYSPYIEIQNLNNVFAPIINEFGGRVEYRNHFYHWRVRKLSICDSIVRILDSTVPKERKEEFLTWKAALARRIQKNGEKPIPQEYFQTMSRLRKHLNSVTT